MTTFVRMIVADISLSYLDEFSCSIRHGQGAGVEAGGGSEEEQLSHLMQTTAGIGKK
jgi:hypothetical protein